MPPAATLAPPPPDPRAHLRPPRTCSALAISGVYRHFGWQVPEGRGGTQLRRLRAAGQFPDPDITCGPPGRGQWHGWYPETLTRWGVHTGRIDPDTGALFPVTGQRRRPPADWYRVPRPRHFLSMGQAATCMGLERASLTQVDARGLFLAPDLLLTDGAGEVVARGFTPARVRDFAHATGRPWTEPGK